MQFLLTRRSAAGALPETAGAASLGGWHLAWTDDALFERRRATSATTFIFGRPVVREASPPPRWNLPAKPAPEVSLDALDGSFAVIHHDRSDGRLWIATDRLGSLMVYGMLGDGAFQAFGTNPATLAGLTSRPAPDVMGILQWVCFGYIPSHRTLVRGIHRLPRAAWLSVEGGGATPYWGWGPAVASGGASLPEAARAVAELEDRAVNRCAAAAPEPPVVLLSGGYDSRAMACRLREARPDAAIQALTYGPRACRDAVAAEAVSRQLRFDWTWVEPRLGDAAAGMAAWAARHGDLCDNVFATLPGGPAQIAAGQGSAFWLATDAFSTVLPPATPDAAELEARFGLPGAPEPVLNALWLLYGAVSRRALDPATLAETGLFSEAGIAGLGAAWWEVMRLMLPLPNEPLDVAFDRISVDTRFRIWHINRRLFETAAVTMTPFHDVDLMEFHGALAQPVRAERRAHIEANLRSLPSYGEVPFHTGVLPMDYLSQVRADPRLLGEMSALERHPAEITSHLDGSGCARALDRFGRLESRAAMALLRVMLSAWVTKAILHPAQSD